jgi:hypothetical protein
VVELAFQIKIIGDFMAIQGLQKIPRIESAEVAKINPCKLPFDILIRIFSRLPAIADLGACSQVSHEWKIASNFDEVWKPQALRDVLGRSLWEEAVHVNVGDEPRFMFNGKPILWKDVCKIHKSPSSYNRALNVRKAGFFFLVPGTIDGVKTTIDLLLEVFARAKMPAECRFDPDALTKCRNIPVKESYWAWRTNDNTVGGVEDGPCNGGRTPSMVEQMINEKGEGHHGMSTVLELITSCFLRYQAGKDSGYVNPPVTRSDGSIMGYRLNLSLTSDTVEQWYQDWHGGHWQKKPVYVGDFVPGEVGRLWVYCPRETPYAGYGACAVRRFI